MSDPLLARIAGHCDHHGLLPHGDGVLALFSGGADSALLVHALARLQRGPLHVLSVDHGLRPDAAAEADAAAAHARALGLPAAVERLGLRPGPGAPARARAARYAVARRVAREHGLALIATGHTRSDQAETVLMRLARGTGRTGALGMAPRTGDLVRPLLTVGAGEARAWCADRGIAVVEDPANADPMLTRARARHGLMPALESLHPGAERHVTAFAGLLRDEAEIVERAVDGAWRRVARPGGLDVAALVAEPVAMRRLLARRLVDDAGLPADALATEAVDRAIAAAAAGSRCDLPGGLAIVEAGVLVVARARPPAPAVALPVPGRARLGDQVVSAEPGPAGRPGPDEVWVSVAGPLTVRPPSPGDRIPLPGGGRQAVGRLLQAAGVPAWRRPEVPVIACAGRVVWVAGHRAAPDLVVAPGAPGVRLTRSAAG